MARDSGRGATAVAAALGIAAALAAVPSAAADTRVRLCGHDDGADSSCSPVTPGILFIAVAPVRVCVRTRVCGGRGAGAAE